jgi:hypothetical protein
MLPQFALESDSFIEWQVDLKERFARLRRGNSTIAAP